MIPILLVIILIQAVLSLSHWLVALALARILGVTSPVLLLAMKWVFAGLSLTFTLSTLLSFRFDNAFVRLFYTLSASWLGIFYLLLAAAAAGTLLRAFGLKSQVLGLALAVLALAAGAYSFWNASRLQITEFEARLPGLPEDWKGKTAVWVSDLHLGPVHREKFAERVVAAVNQLKPEAVFIGGDLFDGARHEPGELVKPLENLKAPRGVFFVTGNHEQFGDPELFLKAVKDRGIRVLDNELADLGGLQVIGVDYRTSGSPESFRHILSSLNISPRTPSILLKHEPGNIPEAEAAGVSLLLSGHTHNGQVFPFKFIASRVYKGFNYGTKNHGSLIVNTSSGTGTWGPPLRLGTRSEIVRITFK